MGILPKLVMVVSFLIFLGLVIGVIFIFVHLPWKCGPLYLKHDPGTFMNFTSLITDAYVAWKSALM